MLRKTPHDVPEDALLSIASRTHGFVGADLSSLVSTAGLIAIKRVFSSPFSSSTAAPTLAYQKLLASDLETALLSTRPSAMREVYLETPKILFSDIGGQEHIKAKLKQSVDWPLRHPEAFKRLGVKPPRGVLLYGPPGCSKTLIAKALATESGLNFIAVKGPEVRFPPFPSCAPSFPSLTPVLTAGLQQVCRRVGKGHPRSLPQSPRRRSFDRLPRPSPFPPLSLP